MKRVSIFGATGSIGQNTIDLISRDPESYDVVALSGGKNVSQLADDARKLGADVAVTSEPALLPELRERLSGSGVEAAAGPEALVEAARRPADWVMSAIVGAAGLQPDPSSRSRPMRSIEFPLHFIPFCFLLSQRVRNNNSEPSTEEYMMYPRMHNAC